MGKKTIRLPLHFCKKSLILTRGCPRILIKVDWRLVPERERERDNKIIGMTKEIGHSFRYVGII